LFAARVSLGAASAARSAGELVRHINIDKSDRPVNVECGSEPGNLGDARRVPGGQPRCGIARAGVSAADRISEVAKCQFLPLDRAAKATEALSALLANCFSSPTKTIPQHLANAQFHHATHSLKVKRPQFPPQRATARRPRQTLAVSNAIQLQSLNRQTLYDRNFV
jgi:hypothetical protein